MRVSMLKAVILSLIAICAGIASPYVDDCFLKAVTLTQYHYEALVWHCSRGLGTEVFPLVRLRAERVWNEVDFGGGAGRLQAVSGAAHTFNRGSCGKPPRFPEEDGNRNRDRCVVNPRRRKPSSL